MKLEDWPRWVGNPSQLPVLNRKEFDEFLKANANVSPSYIAHNSLSLDLSIITMRYAVSDLDGDESKGSSLEATHDDIIRWRDRAKANGLECVIVFTGGRGYHGWVEFKPVKIRNNLAYKGWLTAFNRWMCQDLKTADRKVMGDVRRILRIPNCLYYNKAGKTTGLYAVEVPDDVLDGGLEAVKEYAKSPRPETQTSPKETFPEALSRLKIEPINLTQEATNTPTIEYHGAAPEFVKALIPRMCIHSNLISKQPIHEVRREALHGLVDLNFDLDFLLNFFNDLAQRYEWVDGHNSGERAYQVHYGYRKGKGAYKPYSCESLRALGVCVGKTCPVFDKRFPNG